MAFKFHEGLGSGERGEVNQGNLKRVWDVHQPYLTNAWKYEQAAKSITI
jgi:hypothetical protein